MTLVILGYQMTIQRVMPGAEKDASENQRWQELEEELRQAREQGREHLLLHFSNIL